MTDEIKPLEIPPLPSRIYGLRKDGKRDRRYKRGNTWAEWQEALENACGVTAESQKERK